MTTFVSPLPHERATWHAAARRIFAAIQADLDAEAVHAFEARQERRDIRAQEKAAAAGHTHAQCDRCGKKKVMAWIGGSCTEYDASSADEMCPGTYRAAGAR